MTGAAQRTRDPRSVESPTRLGSSGDGAWASVASRYQLRTGRTSNECNGSTAVSPVTRRLRKPCRILPGATVLGQTAGGSWAEGPAASRVGWSSSCRRSMDRTPPSEGGNRVSSTRGGTKNDIPERYRVALSQVRDVSCRSTMEGRSECTKLGVAGLVSSTETGGGRPLRFAEWMSPPSGMISLGCQSQSLPSQGHFEIDWSKPFSTDTKSQRLLWPWRTKLRTNHCRDWVSGSLSSTRAFTQFQSLK